MNCRRKKDPDANSGSGYYGCTQLLKRAITSSAFIASVTVSIFVFLTLALVDAFDCPGPVGTTALGAGAEASDAIAKTERVL